TDDYVGTEKLRSDLHVKALAQQLTLIGRDRKDLTPVNNLRARVFIEGCLASGGVSCQAAMSIAVNAVAVNRKPIH
ncbi:MAG: hypothetical protein MK538_18165, partial [Planctomycetes bacterium]|nr:hypothetical protein [Planctomycetota bacterium]